MASFYERTDQRNFDEVFGGLSAEEAADLIVGRQALSNDQVDALRYAEGNGGYRLRFDPDPVGHLAFCPVGTRGTGNGGWHLLVPATAACRRLVNAHRRAEFAGRLDAPRETADALFSLVHGYEPVLAAIEAVWPYLVACPSMSDTALRDAGFRPNHPHEKRAIEAVRSVL